MDSKSVLKRQEVQATSWKCEVIADNSGKWCANGCRYATKAEALEAGRELSGRWLLVREWRAVPSTDPVNYAFDFDAYRSRRLGVDDEA